MESKPLPIFILGGPALATEWLSILGSKYRTHADFLPAIVNKPEEALVLVWDGTVTPKSRAVIESVFARLSPEARVLVTGESATLFREHPFVRLILPENRSVFLPPSQELPEDFLRALGECREGRDRV